MRCLINEAESLHMTKPSAWLLIVAFQEILKKKEETKMHMTEKKSQDVVVKIEICKLKKKNK